MKISTELAHQYIAIFINFSTTSSHFHPLQVENCDSNSRLVVMKMTMVNSGLEGLMLEAPNYFRINHEDQRFFFQFEIIIIQLFPIHLNTYVMGLRPLEIFLLLQRGYWL